MAKCKNCGVDHAAGEVCVFATYKSNIGGVETMVCCERCDPVVQKPAPVSAPVKTSTAKKTVKRKSAKKVSKKGLKKKAPKKKAPAGKKKGKKAPKKRGRK